MRTEDLDPVEARSVQRSSGRILDFIIIGVLLLVIAMMIVGRRPFSKQTGESISQKSIAVLPFENLSEDKASAYFADGVQDASITRPGRSRMIADSRRRLPLRQCPKRAETTLSFASLAPSVDSADAGKRRMAGCSKTTRAGWCTRLIHGANA